MLLISPVSFVIHLTFLEFLQVLFLPLTSLRSPLSARSVGDILHVNCVILGRGERCRGLVVKEISSTGDGPGGQLKYRRWCTPSY